LITSTAAALSNFSATFQAEYSLVGEELSYPAPSAAANDSYVFYIGFDPQALKPQPAARKRR